MTGCWFHERRHFAEFIKSVKPKAAKGSIAEKAYSTINEIMYINNNVDNLTNRERKKQRQLKLQEKVAGYFEWVKNKI